MWTRQDRGVQCWSSQASARAFCQRATAKRRITCTSHAEPSPKTPKEVQKYSRAGFINEVQKLSSQSRPDLMKACMLVALEEEAAVREHRDTVFEQFAGDPQVADDIANAPSSSAPTLAPMFSPERLDSLADEALIAFVHSLRLSTLVRLSLRLRCSLTSLAAIPPLLRDHTALFLHTTAELLFTEHGYRRPPAHGRTAAFLMPNVLQDGCGSPIALSILFREVCRRAGLELSVAVMDGGTFCAVWPHAVRGAVLAAGMTVRGHRLVMDPYTGGSVLLAAEVQEFFEVEALHATRDKDLLFALMFGLSECHYAAALGLRCRPSRNSVVEAVEHALNPDIAVEDPFMVSRAIASIDRCLHLKPEHAEMHLYAAALHTVAGNLTRARAHLDLLHQTVEPWMQRLGKASIGHLPPGPFTMENHPDTPPRKGSANPDAARPASLWPRPLWPGRPLEAEELAMVERACSPAQRERWIGRATVTEDEADASEFAAACQVQVRRQPTAKQAKLDASVARRAQSRTRGSKSRRARATAAGGGSGDGRSMGRGKSAPGAKDGHSAALNKLVKSGRVRLTLRAPLPLDATIFESNLLENVQLLRHKVMLLEGARARS